MSLAASIPVASTQSAPPDFKRPGFRPGIWGDTFIQYDSETLEVNENMMQQVQMHKEEVKKMYLSSSNNISQKLNFIDSIQRLGISYHFEREIDEALEQIHNDFTNSRLSTEECSLHFLALVFRLLRQKGYHVTSDIFNKFKNNKGKFNEIIAKDVQGMWSLYEAAQLRIHGEDILDEALDFTYTNLKSMTNQLSPSLAAQINQSLRQPLHREVPRIEARRYLSFYEEDPSHSKVLLTFAKLDFNMLQKVHQQEVGSISKWWNESDFATKVPYTRDRVVEAYFWPLGISFEPKDSTARRMVDKLLACVTLLDDTYDAYGTVEELELFTEAFQRWDISCIKSLPECMKVVFNAIVALCAEIELMAAKGGKLCLVSQYVKQAFLDIAQAYLVESKWCHQGHIPTYDEYKANGVTSSGFLVTVATFIGLGEFASKEVLDWMFNKPTIIKAVSIACRLMNDLASHKFEQQREHVASAVECCMKQYGVSQEEAYKLIRMEISDFWKDINEACLKLDDIPKPVFGYILNSARITEFLYTNFEDKYTNSELLKDYVVALLLDPIVL